MKAFHNDPTIKDKYLARVRHHMAADNLVRGIGWENGKGCAVGCTLEDYKHDRYETELGIPEWLARVEDTLFEGMSVEKSKTWPEVFLSSIKIGDDLERVKAPFIIMVLESTLSTFDNNKFPQVASVVQQSIELWKREDIRSVDWKTAVEAARAALAALPVARSARAAARAAWVAKVTAKAAAGSALAAAWAAWVAEAAAEAAADQYDYFADELIKLLLLSYESNY